MDKKYLNDVFLDEWDSLYEENSIYLKNEEEIPENRTHEVTIIQPSDATIVVTINETGEDHEESFIANYDETYTVRFKNNINPSGLVLNGIQGKITRDITIRTYPTDGQNKHAVFTVTIVQSDNQTIKVLHKNRIKTDTFVAQRYDYFSVTIDANKGYKAGKLNITAGTVTQDITISATPATKISDEYVDINITQSAHQTITVRSLGEAHTRSFAVLKNSRYGASITADPGYLAGAVIDSGEGLASEDVTIYAFPAVIKMYTITIIQSDHQTIYVKYNDTQHTATFANVSYGAELTATIVADEGYDVGTLNAKSYRVTEDFTFYATSRAEVKKFKLNIPATTNQEIDVTYTIPGKSAQHIYSSTVKKYIEVPWGTTWSATVHATSNYYKAGTLDKSSGVVKSNTTIVVSAAELITYSLTVPKVTNQKITVTYREPTSKKTIKKEITGVKKVLNLVKGTEWSATIKADTGYKAGTLSPASGTLNANTTIRVSNNGRIEYELTLPATKNQKITVEYTKPDGTTGKVESGSSAKTISLPYETTWKATVTADEGYKAGTLNKSNGTIKGDTTLTITGASLLTYKLVIPITTNQTLKVTYKLPDGTSKTVSSGSSKQTLTVQHGTKLTAVTVTPATNYDAGTASPAVNTVIKKDTTMTVTEAKLKAYKLTINKPKNGYVIVEIDGVQTEYRAKTTITVARNKSVTVYGVSDDGYKVNAINVS